MPETPFHIRHWGDGREYELNDRAKFQEIYGGDPSWYIVEDEYERARQAALEARTPNPVAAPADNLLAPPMAEATPTPEAPPAESPPAAADDEV